MDLKIIIFNTEWSKSYRERQISYDITYMHNLKKIIQMKLLTKQKQTHRLREWTYSYQVRRHGGDRLGVWDWHAYTAIFKTDNQQGPIV